MHVRGAGTRQGPNTKDRGLAGAPSTDGGQSLSGADGVRPDLHTELLVHSTTPGASDAEGGRVRIRGGTTSGHA